MLFSKRQLFVILFVLCTTLCYGARLNPLPVSVLMRSNLPSDKVKPTSLASSAPVGIDAIKVRRVFPWIPNGIKNGLASGLATVLVKLILQPFDTLKTVQQMQMHSHLSIPAAASYIIQSRGIWGLWSGALVGAVGAAPSVALYFTVYSSLRQYLTK
ncbi:solute carrier family 25 protein [archaeon]|nr:MAG: solute carrier family 25 protein [archaeon]